MFSDETHQALLNLNVFNRSNAMMILDKYESLITTVDLLMKSSMDRDIDGALELTIAIRNYVWWVKQSPMLELVE